MFRPAARFLTGPRPPDFFAARFLAAVILPPLLFFAILNELLDQQNDQDHPNNRISGIKLPFRLPTTNSLWWSLHPTFSQAFSNNCSFLDRALKPPFLTLSNPERET